VISDLIPVPFWQSKELPRHALLVSIRGASEDHSRQRRIMNRLRNIGLHPRTKPVKDTTGGGGGCCSPPPPSPRRRRSPSWRILLFFHGKQNVQEEFHSCCYCSSSAAPCRRIVLGYNQHATSPQEHVLVACAESNRCKDLIEESNAERRVLGSGVRVALGTISTTGSDEPVLAIEHCAAASSAARDAGELLERRIKSFKKSK
jgi:hypothetical protein